MAHGSTYKGDNVLPCFLACPAPLALPTQAIRSVLCLENQFTTVSLSHVNPISCFQSHGPSGTKEIIVKCVSTHEASLLKTSQ